MLFVYNDYRSLKQHSPPVIQLNLELRNTLFT